MAWKTKVSRDANHIEIVNDLKKLGFGVIDLAAVGKSVSDILVARRRLTGLFEIKMSGGYFYLDQLDFLGTWPGVAGFAEVTDDVLRVMNDPDVQALTSDEKRMILEISANARRESDAKFAAKGTKRVKNPTMRVTAFTKLFRAAGGRI